MPDTARTRSAPTVVPVRITFRTAVFIVASILFVLVARDAFVAAHRILGWAAACTAVAVFVQPVAGYLGRFIPRVAAVLLTFAAVTAVVLGIVFGSVDNLDTEVDRLDRSLPAAAARLEARDDEIGSAMRDLRLTERTESFLSGLDDRVGSGTTTLAQNVPAAPVYFVNAILTIFLLVYGPPIVRAGLDRIEAPERRIIAESTLHDAVTRTRRTVAALLAQGAVTGGVVWTMAVLVDLPAPIVLGLFAGVVAMLPDFGLLLGIAPTVALVAGLHGARWVIPITVAAAVAQGVEALYIRRLVDRFGVAIGPALVWIVALLAFTIYGVGGAVVAVLYAIFALSVLDQVPAARKALQIVRDSTAR